MDCETVDHQVLAHEIGHNLAANHDQSNIRHGIGTPEFPYGRGTCDTEAGWNTIMAYASNGVTEEPCVTRTGLFSSPLLRFRGRPTGQAGYSDNRRVLLETAARVAAYRRAVHTEESVRRTLPLVLSAATPGRMGFVRVVNRTDREALVRVTAVDDAGRDAGDERLVLPARGATHFNSHELEHGSASKGLGGVGPGTGHWRLRLESTLDFSASAYVRMGDGFVTNVDAIVAPEEGSGGTAGSVIRTVEFFNPARNRAQRSRLRLVNEAATEAVASITATDDEGRRRGPVEVRVPAGEAATLDSVALEEEVGEGAGKWRLRIEAPETLLVMVLLESPTGHLSNLSRAGIR